MSPLNLSDVLLVNRGGQSYKLQVSDIAEIRDDDLLLVNRSGSSYKITGDDFKNSVIGIQPGINDISISPSVTGSGSLGDPFILSPVQIGPWGANTQCDETITINGQAAVAAVIWTDLSSAVSGARFEQPDSLTDASGVWSGKLVYNDTPASTVQTTYTGDIKIGSLYFRWNVQQNETNEIAPALSSVSLVEVDAAGDRFTSQAFTVGVTLAQEGVPASDKQLKGYVEGTLKKHVLTDEITNTASGTLGGWSNAAASSAQEWRGVTYGNGKYVAVSAGNAINDRVMYSTDAINWSAANSQPVEAYWNAIAYGNGKFVAMGSGGDEKVMYSTDGINWTATATKTMTTTWQAITYGAGKFVAVAGSGDVMYSTDGISWTAGVSGNSAKNWMGVTYGNGKYVATGDYATMYSTDGINWTSPFPLIGNCQWRSVTYGDGKFVAVADSGNVPRAMYSTDGINWTAVSVTDYMYNTKNWRSVVYAEGKFVAVSNDYGSSMTAHSTDGMNWTSFAPVSTNAWQALTHGDGKFVAVSDGGTQRVMWSDTGVPAVSTKILTFATDTDLADFSDGDTVSQDALFTPVTSAITNVTTGSSPWTFDNSIASSSTTGIAQPRSMEFGGGIWAVIIQDNGGAVNNFVMTSTDGANWTKRTIVGIGNQELKSIGYNPDNGKWAIGLEVSRDIWMSSDNCVTWSKVVTDDAHVLDPTAMRKSFAYGNSIWCSALKYSSSGRTRYSTDGGTSWQITSASRVEDPEWCVYGNGVFVQGGGSAGSYQLAYSTNGSTWTLVTAADVVGTSWSDCVFADGKFTAVSENGSGQKGVMQSTDGINWTVTDSDITGPSGQCLVTHNGTYYIRMFNQHPSYVYLSTNGTSWEVTTDSVVANLYSLAAQDGGQVIAMRGAAGNGLNSQLMRTGATNGKADIDLTLTDNSNLSGFIVGDNVTETSGDGTGTITNIGATSMTLSPSFGAWNTGSTVTGSPEYYPVSWISAYGITEINTWQSVTYGKGKFVAVSSTGTNRVMYSTDGINWTAANAAEANNWVGVAYGNGKFVAVSVAGTNKVMYSSNGVNWTSASASETSNWRAVTYGDGKFVAVADSGVANKQVMYSTDGISWTTATSHPGPEFYSVTYGGGKFVAVSITGNTRAMYSTDGDTWTAASSGVTNESWNSVTYGNGKFVAVSSTGTNRVMYSTDGINWTAASAAAANSWRAVTYGDGWFVATSSDGIDNRVMYSSDGISWSSAANPPTQPNSWYAVTYGDDKFVSVCIDQGTTTDQVMYTVPVKATGTVNSTDVGNKQMTLTPYTAGWAANVGMKAKGDATVDVSKVFTVLSANGNILSLVEDDPGYTTMTGNPNYTLTFPATFPSGDTPDGDIPEGASFTVDVRATNTAGTSDLTTNVVVPDGVVGNFSTTLYSGNGVANTQIINGIDNTSESLVWIRARNRVDNHVLSDSIRGKGVDNTYNRLFTNNDSNQQSSSKGLSSFNNNGFTTGGVDDDTNGSSYNYVAWNFKAGNKFLEIIEYTGESNVQVVPHNLGTQPGLIMCKSVDIAGDWVVYHKSIGATYYGKMNSDDAFNQANFAWNDTEPTSTNFTVGFNAFANTPNEPYVAYLFAEDEEFIKCGSYTATGSPMTIDMGFEPQWLLIKNVSSTADWYIWDKARDPNNPAYETLMANTTAAENGSSGNNGINWRATGIQIIANASGGTNSINYTGDDYMYVAIAAPPDGVLWA